MSKDSTADAIRDTFGGGERYYGIITDALYDGLTNIAKSIQGIEDNGCRNHKASLCQSLDGIADAINNLSEAVRYSGKMASSRAKWAAEDASENTTSEVA